MKVIAFACMFTIVGTNSCRSQPFSDNREFHTIVLVNVGWDDNGKIAREISILNGLNPKVLALDLAFSKYVGDKRDRDLVSALEKMDQIILPSRIRDIGEDGDGKRIISITGTCQLPVFPINLKEGFVSAITDSTTGLKIPRQFMLWENDYEGRRYLHFSVVTAMAYDSLQVSRYLDNHDQHVSVAYKGRDHDFKVFSGQEVREGKVTRKDITGKIIIMGFLGPGVNDKWISPLNQGGEPDMYGVEYLAHIVAQILGDEN